MTVKLAESISRITDNISYEKTMQYSHLLIHEICEPESFEWGMLTNTHVPGSVPVRLRDESRSAEYDITSLTSLAALYETDRMSYQDLALLLEGLNQMLQTLENYMLSESMPLLRTNTVFFDEENRNFLFLLYPGNQEPFSRSLSRLLGSVLEFIDYGSDRTLILAERLYRKSIEENYSIEDLNRIVRLNLSKAMQEEQTAFLKKTSFNRQGIDSVTEDGKYEGTADHSAKDPLSELTEFTEDGIFRLKPINPEGGNALSPSGNSAPQYGSGLDMNGVHKENGFLVTDQDSPARARQAEGSRAADRFRTGSAGETRNLSEYPQYGESQNEEVFQDVLVSDLSHPAGHHPAAFLSLPFCRKKNRQTDAPGHIMGIPGENDDSVRNDKYSRKKEAPSGASLKRQTCLFLLVMMLLPLLIWALKGIEVFQQYLPLIILLEAGTALLLILNILIRKLPELEDDSDLHESIGPSRQHPDIKQ